MTSTRPRSRWRPAASRTASRPTSPTAPRRPKEKATAEAFSRLSRVGIKLTLKPYPQGDYFSSYAGNPPYVVKNKLVGAQRVGGRLAGWLRLPVPDRRLAGHPRNRWLLQHQCPHPRGRPDARQCSPGARHRGAIRCGANRQAGDGGSRDLSRRVLQGSAGAFEEDATIFVNAWGMYDYVGLGAQK